ncbi:MAG: M4 family metallopeptidase [Bacteroidota bacterium]
MYTSGGTYVWSIVFAMMALVQSVCGQRQAYFGSTYFQESSMRLAGESPAEIAASFLNYSADPPHLQANDLQLLRQERDWMGAAHLFFVQTIGGVPILGAEIALHYNIDGQLTSATGTALENELDFNFRLPQVESFPKTPPLSHFNLAPILYLRSEPDPQNWHVTKIEPIYVIPYLIDRKSSKEPVAAFRLQLESKDGLRAYEAYIDANTQRAIFTFPLHCNLLERRLYNQSLNVNNLLWSEGDPLPGALNQEQQDVLEQTEQTYNLFFHSFGRDSYDGEGGIKNIIYDPPFLACPNASAGQDRIAVCTGIVADDVTAHEWTHSHIFNTSRLIIAYESGALNEALADIFGEVVDLINGTGNDTGIDTPRASCNETNTRWKIAEDAPVLNGHIRDMAFPNCLDCPDDRQDSLYYCGEESQGGIYINSGLINRCFVLLTDGGTHNGVEVDGIGLTKSTHLFAHTMLYYLTRVTDFYTFGQHLRLAGQDLLGQELPQLTTEDIPGLSSGEMITQADLHVLDSALAAIELFAPSPCQYGTLLAPNAPAPCPPDSNLIVFAEDWEDGLTGWTATQEPENPNDWIAREWTLDSLLPDGRIGKGVFAPTPFTTNCLNELQNGTIRLISPHIGIPQEEGPLTLSFDHYFCLQNGRDGGLLYIRRVNGNWVQVTPPFFSFNGYPDRLDPPIINNNPDANLWAFTGADSSSTTGSWGTSQVDLTAVGILPGDSIQLAWHLSTDGCDALLGWYLDDIEIAACIENALPVELLDFSARWNGSAVDLVWQTGEEIDNAGFYVERSVNGIAFDKIAWVNARGTGSSYVHEDRHVQAGRTNYYRLRQVDLDGSEQLSEVVAIEIPDQGSEWQIWPNPAVDELQVLGLEPGSFVYMRVYDLAGRLLIENTISTNEPDISIGQLKPGVYILKLDDEVFRFVKR